MKFLSISKFLLILILPLLLFLLVLDFTVFDDSFYKTKFSEYNVASNVNEPAALHEKVMGFLQGKSQNLPDDFDSREKEHLLDVKSIVDVLKIILYALIFLFVIFLLASSFVLKISNSLTSFIGKVLVFGGFLTIFIALLLFFFMTTDFSSSFESFHQAFFSSGSYLFDPANEVIVRLYPEQLFMDLGIRVSRNVMIASAFLILVGAYFLFKSKPKAIKRKR